MTKYYVRYVCRCPSFLSPYFTAACFILNDGLNSHRIPYEYWCYVCGSAMDVVGCYWDEGCTKPVRPLLEELLSR